MAFGQVDPARLDGEALRRWYGRSPMEIEQEREAAAALRYDDFFGGIRPSSKGAAGQRLATRPEADEGFHRQGSGYCAHCARDSDWRAPQPAARGRQATLLGAGIKDCVTCHGRLPPPPLPFPVPFPWPRLPTQRDAPRSSPSPRPHPKQCEVQHGRDREVCDRQPNTTAQAMCHSSAMERLAYCIKTDGEVGWPPLFTHPNGPRR